MNGDRASHWQQVYATKGHTEVSWYQPIPEKSLGLIRSTRIPLSAPILDVGGGASTLVDYLLDDGYSNISVIDVAAAAFDQSRSRLGARADQVTWIESDITRFEPACSYAIWHDRATFHFLTEANDRKRYLDVLRRALQPAGHLLLATFGLEGPLRCSGLDIQRYSLDRLQDLLGPDFHLRSHEIDQHQTPTGAVQQFFYGWWQLAG